MRRLLLLRHTAVAPRWAGVCYGRSDAGLGEAGRRHAHVLATTLGLGGFDQVVASPSRRARLLGGLLARRLATPLEIEPRLAERDFGTWEGRRWQSIWQETGSAMDGMIEAPVAFRPGGGETTAELAARARAWFDGLPVSCAVVAVAHGGPIAALVGGLLGETPRDWLRHVPAPGEGLLLEAAAGAPPCLTALPEAA